MKAKFIVAAIAIVASASGAVAQGYDLGAVDRYVNAELGRTKTPGIALAIVSKGEVVLAKGYGLSNVEHRVPVTTETIFQSGSVGKQFTSAAIMLLVEDGLIKLDDPVSKYLTGAPAAWAPIKVRHLLTHTSGIPDYTTDAMDYRKDYTEADLEKMAYGLKLEFPAGSRWNYSNTGYVMLGIIARKASGKFYGDILKDRIFAPLGMKTARVISEADIVPNRSGGYQLVRGELKNQEWVAPQMNTTADGSLYLSILDMIAWDKGLRTKAVLKPESWKQIFGQARLSSGNPYPYGFGWTIDSIGGQLRIHHGGAWQGFKSYIARYMGDDLTIIALGNLAQFDPGGFVDGVAKILNPTLAAPELEPMEDRDPAVRARLEQLLTMAKDGKLTEAEFAYVRAGFFPNAARSYQQRLSALGTPKRFTLLGRKVQGDDKIYTYEVEYETMKLLVGLALAPDNKVSSFNLRPR